MDKSELLQLIDSFSKKEILVIGDTIVDHYIYGTLLGTSAETPTLVAKELKQTFSLGGASLVCRNLLQLKSKVHFMTLVGNDTEAELIKKFSHPGLFLYPWQEEDRKTTVKRRYWVDGYKLLQFDQLDDRPISAVLENQILKTVQQLISSVSAVIFSDYRHGLLTPSLIESLLKIAREAGVVSFVDSQVSQKHSNHHLYQGASVMCLNLKEAKCVDPQLSVPQKAADFQRIKERLNISNIVIKQGEQGSVACLHEHLYITPALRVQPVDPCGAGDAFLAALSVSGLQKPNAALQMANIWAGLSTTTLGPQPPAFEKLIEVLEKI